MSVKLLTEHHLEFLSLTEAAPACLSLHLSKCHIVGNILRKTIEGYLESVPSLTFITIKTKLIVHAFHSSIYLQSN